MTAVRFATRPAMKAQHLVQDCFRQATKDAREWIIDCFTTVLPDGRKTELLGLVDVWCIIESQYDGGVEGFIKDGQYND